MSYFNEQSLESSILELFARQGYEVLSGESIPRLSRELILKEELLNYLFVRYAAFNITELEAAEIIAEIEHVSTGSDYLDNKTVFEKISNGFIFHRQDCTQKDFWVNYIDYTNPVDGNSFKIVNQFEVQGSEFRIPDAVIFINGIPLIVLEFKSTVREDTTIFDAYEQVSIRYRRGITDLFKYNAFVVLSDGINSKIGSHFAPYEYFYSWRKITGEDSEQIANGIDSLNTMVQGLFDKTRLIDVIGNFIYFPDKSDREEKVVCRYPQYYAARKLYANILSHRKPNGDGKGGVYFGATGCGKSITILYLSRLLMKSKEFSAPTLVLITDRTDLDTQLSELFEPSKTFLGEEKIKQVASRSELKIELGNTSDQNSITSGGIFLTTVHKFTEDINLLTDRNNVICISDEAHRSQLNLQQKITVTDEGVIRKYGFAKYLHDSLPNATYVGFTGTPIDETLQVFGRIVDRYTMTDSVDDGITVKLIYDGRAAKVGINQLMIEEIENYYQECAKQGSSPYQIDESKEETTQLKAIISHPDRLQRVAEDFIAHYESRVAERATVAGKVLFVCYDRIVAYAFYSILEKRRPDWFVIKAHDENVLLEHGEKEKIKPSPMVRMVMTRGKDDVKELYELLGDDFYRKELARQFKQPKSNFKIALIVDMWLTGFDVPELDVIYLDKPIQKHNLIQAISRVNRKCEGKQEGIIVDYIGIKKHLDEAINTYTSAGHEGLGIDGVEIAINLVRTQIEVLKAIVHPIDALNFFCGTPIQQLNCLKKAAERVQITKKIEDRFMVQSKILKDAFSLSCSGDFFSDEELGFCQFFIAIRSIIHKLIIGDAPDTEEMNRHVRKLLEDAISSDAVEVLFQEGKSTEENGMNLFDEKYLNKILLLDFPNTKVRLLQKLLKAALKKVRRINKLKAVEFSERLSKMVERYNDREADKAAVRRVIGDLVDDLTALIEDIQVEQKAYDKLGISYQEKTFYDILKSVSIKHNFPYEEQKFVELSKAIMTVVTDKAKYANFLKRADIKAQLERDIILLLGQYGYPPIYNEEVFAEILDQTENFKKNI